MVVNSKQRRKTTRYIKNNYPYIVSIEAPLYMNFNDWDDKVDDMTQWCEKHYSTGWMRKWFWGEVDFHFSDGKIATHFTLKWT
jgi:hypothetical protein